MTAESLTITNARKLYILNVERKKIFSTRILYHVKLLWDAQPDPLHRKTSLSASGSGVSRHPSGGELPYLRWACNQQFLGGPLAQHRTLWWFLFAPDSLQVWLKLFWESMVGHFLLSNCRYCSQVNISHPKLHLCTFWKTPICSQE